MECEYIVYIKIETGYGKLPSDFHHLRHANIHARIPGKIPMLQQIFFNLLNHSRIVMFVVHLTYARRKGYVRGNAYPIHSTSHHQKKLSVCIKILQHFYGLLLIHLLVPS